ncbi:hypothetical protein B296_00024514 [Ensete ventricosum]|uniref:Uncharacterized protein n=1 Tax=Ensete ventricosum TaxID=4639 RepID=A0A426ZWJ9_ENSVE|nr:hypothetical protein B296_00024514 [Ensete ventricosum]
MVAYGPSGHAQPWQRLLVAMPPVGAATMVAVPAGRPPTGRGSTHVGATYGHGDQGSHRLHRSDGEGLQEVGRKG